VIEQGVKFDSTLGFPKLRPVEKGKAQADGRSVKAVEFALEFELVLGRDVAAPVQELKEQCFEGFGTSAGIGIGKSRTTGRQNPEVIPSSGMGFKSGFDFTDGTVALDLGKQHGDEMIPTPEFLGIPVVSRAFAGLVEFFAGEEFQDLLENGSFGHNGCFCFPICLMLW